ncbi:MAG: hypothetical protein L3J52_04910 [Proteobacteria bacterium]|nr:hypothetical protein [Pseudomonadota bacterium]
MLYLLIVAVFNLMAGLTYLAGGAATQGLSKVVDSAMMEQSRSQMTAEDKAKMDQITDQVDASGAGLMAFGVFLLVSVGLLIAGAVFLFTNKKPQFILIVGGVAILAEVIGMMISTFGITNILGLVGGVLAIITAKSMSAGSAPVDAE